tara:strand:- start:167 stop:397 length:231 start_codon:yes stop_codon:yes gene_type:complete
MERNKYIKEIEGVLDQLLESKSFLRKTLVDAENELHLQVYRYASKKGERTYENLAELKKVKNLIDYLILLRENKDD